MEENARMVLICSDPMHSHGASAIRAHCHVQVEGFEWRRRCLKSLAFALQWLWMILNQWVLSFGHCTFFLLCLFFLLFDPFMSVCGRLACPGILNQDTHIYIYIYYKLYMDIDISKLFWSTKWEIRVQRIIDRSLSNQHLQRPSDMQWTHVFSWEPWLSPGHSRFLKGLACPWILVVQISMFEGSEFHQPAMLRCKQIN